MKDGDDVLNNVSSPIVFLRTLFARFVVKNPVLPRQACVDFFLQKPNVTCALPKVCLCAARRIRTHVYRTPPTGTRVDGDSNGRLGRQQRPFGDEVQLRIVICNMLRRIDGGT